MQLTKKRVSIISVCLVLVLLFSLIINSLGYFSDTIFANSNGTVGTVDVNLDDSGINLLNQYGQDILNPGDMRPVKFTITNDGNKSVDTEVIITLTTMRSMSNNDCDTSVQDKEVYSSEYELYYEKDVEFIDGYGYYPKAGAKPIDVRYKISDNQIIYILDGTVLSGNLNLDEQEVEYELKADYIAQPSDLYVLVEEQDFVIETGDLTDDLLDCNYANVVLSTNFTNSKIVIPNVGRPYGSSPMTIVEVYTDYVLFQEYAERGIGIPESVTDIYVGSTVEAFIIGNPVDGSTTVYTKEEFESAYGVSVHYYHDLDELKNGVPTHITTTEYEALSETEKTNYVKCDDSKAFDIVLLFDPHSGNAFQNSSVSIQIEAKAKQHRNTEMGWELFAETTTASIDESVFVVENDIFGRVTITGFQWGVDVASLTDVEIPEGVEVIPATAFYHMTNLKTVKLPSTIKRIEYAAFADCVSLTTINLPEGLEHISSMAFWDSGINEIVIPGTVTFIGEEAFYSCDRATTIVIPDSVEYIEDNAFDSKIDNLETTVYTNNNVVKNATNIFNNRIVTILPYEEYGA